VVGAFFISVGRALARWRSRLAVRMSADGKEIVCELGPDEIADPAALRRQVARALGCGVDAVPAFKLRKRSIDARRGSVRFRLVLTIGGEPDAELGLPHPREVEPGRRVVIVGTGPAGLFCSYELARRGIASVLVERGKQVQPRRRDLKLLNQGGQVDRDSNYCFGEGGAGTYSDGKLYTRANKRGDVRDVVEILVASGAPERILVDARPHIGSNQLPKVVTALRERLEACGVEFRFGARMTGLDVAGGTAVGVRLESGERISGDAVVLATGHSARDVLEAVHARGAVLEAKPFALGLRIEHPQPLINQIQYGSAAGHPALPAASYRLAQEIEGRGVFSFCMCPGGWIVPAATDPSGLVVNGMSLSRRDSPFANSGIVVAIEPADLEAAGYRGPLAGIEFQRRVEAAALVAGGGMLRAPATRLPDFLAGRASSTTESTSYVPGLMAGNIAEVLDGSGLLLSGRLAAGLRRFCKKMRGFQTEQAMLVGVESRTSSPVRIRRDHADLQAETLPGLYPCGEGAGYAGGIVSAALDGMRVARAIAAHI